MQNDITNTTSANPAQPPADTVTPMPSLDDRVLESSRAILEGTQVPQVSRQPMPQPTSYSHVSAPQSSARLVRDTISNKIIKNTVVLGAILVLVVGAFALLKGSLSGFGTKSLSNSGYTYTFSFYKSANKVSLSDGSSGYSYQNHMSVKGQPVNGAIPTSCSKYSGSWQQAFTVQLGGKPYPVCTSNNNGSYAMYFSSLNHNQLFILTNNSARPATVNSTVKSIFGSIHVT
jgi:hypothetical protein